MSLKRKHTILSTQTKCEIINRLDNDEITVLESQLFVI